MLPNSKVRRLEPACFRPLTQGAQAKVDTLEERLAARGDTWSARRPYLVHPHVSAERLRLNRREGCLCLSTKCHEFWLLGRDRYLSSIEALRVQGFDEQEDFDSTVLMGEIPKTERYRQAGNAMHVGLLESLLGALLTASGDLGASRSRASTPCPTNVRSLGDIVAAA